MAHQEPEGIQFPVVWVGVEETPIQFTNLFISQFDQDMETFIITFGQLSPPVLIGTPDEIREQAEQITYVSVRPVARISLSRLRMKELIAALSANADQLEQASNTLPGDPR